MLLGPNGRQKDLWAESSHALFFIAKQSTEEELSRAQDTPQNSPEKATETGSSPSFRSRVYEHKLGKFCIRTFESRVLSSKLVCYCRGMRIEY